VTARARANARVLYVTDGFAPFVIGGMQSYARRQLETLADAGYDLTSLSPSEPDAPLPWRNIALGWPGRSLLAKLDPWRYVRDLKRYSERVARIADELRPDVIYSEGPLLHTYLHRADRPARTIFNPHGLEMFQRKGSLKDDVKSWPLRGIVADHARRADVVACLSDSGQLNHILQDRIGVPPGRIAVLPNAAPETVAAPRNGQSGKRRFLFVGRDEPRKALPLLTAAFRNMPDAELDIVGANGPTGGNIRFRGEVRDRARIRQFYADADFLVAPSHAEGMPTVVLEAFAAALPVIATDVGANADLVQSGTTGFLIPRADRAALENAVHQAMHMPDTDYARLSANCLEMARTRFSAQQAGDRLLTLLDGLPGMDKSD